MFVKRLNALINPDNISEPFIEFGDGHGSKADVCRFSLLNLEKSMLYTPLFSWCALLILINALDMRGIRTVLSMKSMF